MKADKLTEAEIQQIGEHWWRQKERRELDKPWDPKTELNKRVPFNELPETSVGALVAAAIRGELEDYGPREQTDFTFTPYAIDSCRNCGRVRKLGDLDDDGWCWEGRC